MPDPSSKFRLTDRDRQIIDHVARYRLTFREIVQKLFLPECDINAVTKVLSRLTVAGLLARHQLHNMRYCWTLSVKSALQRGLDDKRANALGYEAAVYHYGVLMFCCGGGTLRQLLTSKEVDQQFPEHSHRSLLRSAYYVDHHDGQDRLGLILVDRGEDYQRLVRKCRREVYRRQEIPAFFKRIREGGFVISIVTAFPEKKAKLEQALEDPSYRSVLYRVVLRRGLADLLVNRAPKHQDNPRPDQP